MGLSAFGGVNLKAVALVAQSTGTFYNQRGFASVARPGAGVSNLTCDGNTTVTAKATGADYPILTLLNAAGNTNASLAMTAAAPQVVVSCFVVAAATDADFCFALLGIQ